MKKTIKAVAAVILVIVMCMSLTGCVHIDKMRERQGYVTKEGTIMLNGNEYLPLPYCEALCPDYRYYYDFDSESLVYITEEDVPVLLSSTFGESCEISADKVFIHMWDNFSSNYINYCREDKYDEIYEAINNGYQPDGYKYTYYDYSEDFAIDYEKERIFTDEEIEAINTVLSGATCDEIEDYYSDYLYAEVYSYSEDLPFEMYEFDILKYSGRYFVMVPDYIETFDYDIYYETTYDWYKVPAELEAVFEKIMAECEGEYEYWKTDYEYSYELS